MGFPMNPPMEAIGHIIEYIKNPGNPEKHLLEDGYDVLGYSCYLAIGTERKPIYGDIPTDEGTKQMALVEGLEGLKNKQGPFPSWLAQALLILMQQLLEQLLKPKEEKE